MNDIDRPSSFLPDRHPWSRRLDRLVVAAAAGLSVASPRSALLAVDVLGRRVPGPASRSTPGPACSGAARDRRTGR